MMIGLVGAGEDQITKREETTANSQPRSFDFGGRLLFILVLSFTDLQ